MDRIADTFDRCLKEGRAAFIAYLCAGDPDPHTSFRLCQTLLENGVDLLELGLPFSDPLADGPVNQQAAQRALAAGMTTGRTLDLVRQIRAIHEAPLTLYAYYNMIFTRGLDRFAAEAVEAGLDGALILDLPPEEAEPWLEACQRSGLKTVFIVAPTTPPDRIARIASVTTGFIYYVSREGVTGVRDDLATNIGSAISSIRHHTRLPIAVGFGISNPLHVRMVASVADGVVVGSALVGEIARHPGQPDRLIEAMRGKVLDLSSAVTR